MKSFVIVKQKGGVGGSFSAEMICEGLHTLGLPALLLEIETNQSRLGRLKHAGRVRDHGFVVMPGSEEVLNDQNVVATFWEAPLEIAMSQRPVVIDIGAQGYASLEFYAQIGVETSPLGQADGQHGRGIVFCCPTDASVEGQREATASVIGLRSLFPGADIVVIGTLGADLVMAQRIASAAPGVRAMMIETAPALEIFRLLFAQGGVFGTSDMLRDESRLLIKAKEWNIDRVVMLLAKRKLTIWMDQAMNSVIAMIKDVEGVGAAELVQAPSEEKRVAEVAEIG
jgi:hypothetical protein